MLYVNYILINLEKKATCVICWFVVVIVQSLSCVWLFCNFMDCRLPVSTVHGMEWVSISVSRMIQIFPTQGLNLHLLHWQAGEFFTPPGKLLICIRHPLLYPLTYNMTNYRDFISILFIPILFKFFPVLLKYNWQNCKIFKVNNVMIWNTGKRYPSSFDQHIHISHI